MYTRKEKNILALNSSTTIYFDHPNQCASSFIPRPSLSFFSPSKIWLDSHKPMTLALSTMSSRLITHLTSQTQVSISSILLLLAICHDLLLDSYSSSSWPRVNVLCPCIMFNLTWMSTTTIVRPILGALRDGKKPPSHSWSMCAEKERRQEPPNHATIHLQFAIVKIVPLTIECLSPSFVGETLRAEGRKTAINFSSNQSINFLDIQADEVSLSRLVT